MSGCCPCGTPELSDLIAVNKSYVSQCSCVSQCACAGGVNPNLAATCSSGVCRGFDVRQVDALSACTSNADCELRIGLGCCPGCQATASNLIAIRTGAEPKLEEMLCGAAGYMCPQCLPAMPPNTVAACVQGHCQVVSQ